MTISKEKYDQFVAQSIELLKQKILVEKLKESIKKKCCRTKELNKVISRNKYWLKKTAQKFTEKEKEEQTKKRKECTVSFGEKCSLKYAYMEKFLCL